MTGQGEGKVSSRHSFHFHRCCQMRTLFCFIHSRFAIPSAKFILILSSVTLFMTWCHDPFRFCLQYSFVRILSHPLSISLPIVSLLFCLQFPTFPHTHIDLFAHFLATYVVSTSGYLVFSLSSKIFIKKNATETEINHLELIFFHRKFVTRSFFNAFMYTVLSLGT